jgi:hypothetical protein
MGTEICTCLNNLMDMDSEDLSRDQNENTDNNNTKKKVNKKPKVVLNRKDSLDSENPFQSGREKDSISTNINSEYKNTLTNHNQQTQREQTNQKKQNIKNKNNNNNNNNNNNRNNNSNNNITNSNNNLTNKKTINNNSSNNTSNNNINRNSKNNNIKKEEKIKKPSIDFDKILNRDQMVSENFNKFFNSQQGQEMILNMDDAKNKICVTLHKYFVSLITRRKYKKNLKYFQEEKKSLFQKCLDIIYNSNPNLQKLEKISPLKYTSDGYMKYYPEQKDQEKMKFDPQKESFDNCIIINYEEDDSSSLDKMLWIYSGQVNKIGLPHGLGEKIFKNGIKQKGYWKSGEMCGWGMILDAYGTIFMGPFFDGKGVTGLGEKFSLRKKAYYKGEFMDGEKSGKGEEDSNEGYFVGNYYHDKKNGKGKMKYKLSGDEYEGDYKNDLFDGQGHYIWKMTGQQYTGDYKAGMMHGKGLFEYSEGEYYKGDFVNGKKEGEGELHMGNGRSYIGPFVNGRPNGIGIFDNGINFKGEVEFAEGKMDINFIKKKYIDKDNKNIDNEENNKENKDINEIKEVKEING